MGLMIQDGHSEVTSERITAEQGSETRTDHATADDHYIIYVGELMIR